MARGTWNETNIPIIPGFYNRMKQKAQEAAMSSQGVLAMPVRSNWGQKEKVVAVKSLRELKKSFGDSMDFTAYKLGKLALLGGPQQLLLYRVVDENAKVGTLVLKTTADSPAITLTTLYETSRKFKITVGENILDSGKIDITLYEDTTQLATIEGVNNTIDDVVTKINDSDFIEYITASKVNEATGTLSTISATAFTGGNDGSTACTSADYLKAMAAFESYDIDGFVFDGVSDKSLLDSAISWKDKCAEFGLDILVFGSTNADSLASANVVSKEFNDHSMHNGFAKTLEYDGIQYTISEAMVWFAAHALGQKLTESMCNEETIFTDVQPRLSRTQLESALDAGTVVFTVTQGKVVVLDDVNTYKAYSSEAEKILGNLRAVRFINIVNKNTSLKGESKYVGKISNDDTGHAIILSGIKNFFDEWVAMGIISSDYTVETDTDLQVSAEPDQFFWKWGADYIEVAKRIFGTGNLQYTE